MHYHLYVEGNVAPKLSFDEKSDEIAIQRAKEFDIDRTQRYKKREGIRLVRIHGNEVTEIYRNY